jgi:hypothetical protein
MPNETLGQYLAGPELGPKFRNLILGSRKTNELLESLYSSWGVNTEDEWDRRVRLAQGELLKPPQDREPLPPAYRGPDLPNRVKQIVDILEKDTTSRDFASIFTAKLLAADKKTQEIFLEEADESNLALLTLGIEQAHAQQIGDAFTARQRQMHPDMTVAEMRARGILKEGLLPADIPATTTLAELVEQDVIPKEFLPPGAESAMLYTPKQQAEMLSEADRQLIQEAGIETLVRNSDKVRRANDFTIALLTHPGKYKNAYLGLWLRNTLPGLGLNHGTNTEMLGPMTGLISQIGKAERGSISGDSDAIARIMSEVAEMRGGDYEAIINSLKLEIPVKMRNGEVKEIVIGVAEAMDFLLGNVGNLKLNERGEMLLKGVADDGSITETEFSLSSKTPAERDQIKRTGRYTATHNGRRVTIQAEPIFVYQGEEFSPFDPDTDPGIPGEKVWTLPDNARLDHGNRTFHRFLYKQAGIDLSQVEAMDWWAADGGELNYEHIRVVGTLRSDIYTILHLSETFPSDNTDESAGIRNEIQQIYNGLKKTELTQSQLRQLPHGEVAAAVRQVKASLAKVLGRDLSEMINMSDAEINKISDSVLIENLLKNPKTETEPQDYSQEDRQLIEYLRNRIGNTILAESLSTRFYDIFNWAADCLDITSESYVLDPRLATDRIVEAQIKSMRGSEYQLKYALGAYAARLLSMTYIGSFSGRKANLTAWNSALEGTERELRFRDDMGQMEETPKLGFIRGATGKARNILQSIHFSRRASRVFMAQDFYVANAIIQNEARIEGVQNPTPQLLRDIQFKREKLISKARDKIVNAYPNRDWLNVLNSRQQQFSYITSLPGNYKGEIADVELHDYLFSLGDQTTQLTAEETQGWLGALRASNLHTIRHSLVGEEMKLWKQKYYEGKAGIAFANLMKVSTRTIIQALDDVWQQKVGNAPELGSGVFSAEKIGEKLGSIFWRDLFAHLYRSNDTAKNYMGQMMEAIISTGDNTSYLTADRTRGNLKDVVHTCWQIMSGMGRCVIDYKFRDSHGGAPGSATAYLELQPQRSSYKNAYAALKRAGFHITRPYETYRPYVNTADRFPVVAVEDNKLEELMSVVFDENPKPEMMRKFLAFFGVTNKKGLEEFTKVMAQGLRDAGLITTFTEEELNKEIEAFSDYYKYLN